MFLNEEKEELHKALIETGFDESAASCVIDLVTKQKRKRGNFEGTCRMCGEDLVKVRNIDLYVIGSEGLNACHDCEMLLVSYVNTIRRFCSTA